MRSGGVFISKNSDQNDHLVTQKVFSFFFTSGVEKSTQLRRLRSLERMFSTRFLWRKTSSPTLIGAQRRQILSVPISDNTFFSLTSGFLRPRIMRRPHKCADYDRFQRMFSTKYCRENRVLRVASPSTVWCAKSAQLILVFQISGINATCSQTSL